MAGYRVPVRCRGTRGIHCLSLRGGSAGVVRLVRVPRSAAQVWRKRPWVLRSAWALAFLFKLHFRVPCPGSYYVGAGSDCVLDHALDEYHPVQSIFRHPGNISRPDRCNAWYRRHCRAVCASDRVHHYYRFGIFWIHPGAWGRVDGIPWQYAVAVGTEESIAGRRSEYLGHVLRRDPHRRRSACERARVQF